MAKANRVKAEVEARSFIERSKTRSAMSDFQLRGKLPLALLRAYEVHEWKHAAAILKQDFPNELENIISILSEFRLHHEDVVAAGGGKSPVSQKLNEAFADKGWEEKRWNTAILLNSEKRESPTHEVDCVKSRVALEIEWSNKDPFFDRDLNNFRLLFDLRAISVGVIITKSDELAGVFHDIHDDVWKKYGTTTTWMSKLLPRIEGGGGGGCPVLVFGIRRSHYRPPGDPQWKKWIPKNKRPKN